MSRSICNKQGVTLIESVIAILLVSIGLLGLLSMQPSAWQTSTRTDHLGRAAMMLSKELTVQELRIMNPACTTTAATVDRTLYTSGQGVALSGDIGFRVQTTTASVGTNIWRVTVNVSWPPLNSNGISESIIVTRQQPFLFGVACP